MSDERHRDRWRRYPVPIREFAEMTLVHLQLGVVAVITAATPTSPDLVAETNAWHQQRIERLKAEDGWLSLVALNWLEEGDNAAGSAQDAQVELPKSVPARIGTFTRHGKQVSFTPAKDVAVTLGGKPFTGGTVHTDESGAPDVLRLGSLQMLAIVRGDRVGVRVRDSASPLRREFKGIDRFPVSAAWRKDAKWEPAPEGKTVHITNVLGDVEEAPLAGVAVFTHEGKEYRLEAVKEDDSLFFVFGDETNRTDSYPAGRFLSTELPKDGHVVLDFNRAYNPPCAFTRFATCPLPTKENRLKVRVEAGEKRFGHGHE